MNRRDFLQNAAKLSASVVIGGTLIDLLAVKTIRASSRSGNSPEIREVPINLIDAPDLKPVGGSYHLEVEDLDRDIIVAHVTENTFVAVDIKCPHKGCDVNYQPEEKNFFCPCHSSTFDLSGAVTKGPAKKPLTYYGTRLEGDEVIVTVYGPNDKPPANCVPGAVIAKDSTRTMVDSSHVTIPDSLRVPRDTIK